MASPVSLHKNCDVSGGVLLAEHRSDEEDDDIIVVHYCTLSLFDIWVTRQSAEWEPPISTGTL